MDAKKMVGPIKKQRRRLLIVVGIILAFAGGVFYASVGRTSQEIAPSHTQGNRDLPVPHLDNVSSPLQEKAPLVSVQVLQPHRRDIAYTLRLPGNLAPWYQTTLYAKVPGYLKWIGFDKGDAVRQGTVLAMLDAPEIQQQYEQAQAEYAIKKLTFERMSSVWKNNPDVIAKQDVDVAEAAATGAKHVVAQRATMLDYTKVRAPFSGVITARFVDPGAMIQVATNSETQVLPLFTIMDLSKVRVYVNIPQEDVALAKPGCPVTVTLRQYSQKVFKGTITRTTDVLDSTTRTMLAEAHLPNPDHVLQPGSFAEVVVSLKQHPNAVVIPPAALVTEESGKAVFIIEDGRAKKVPVKTGIDDGLEIEIVSGLEGTEQVVVVGQGQLKEGMSVTTVTYRLPQGQFASQRY